jgi:hypothetical protein
MIACELILKFPQATAPTIPIDDAQITKRIITFGMHDNHKDCCDAIIYSTQI